MLCVDATILVAAVDGDELGSLHDVAGTAVVPGTVLRELTKGLRRHPQNAQVAAAAWLEVRRMDDPLGLQLMNQLHVVWGSTPPKNDGEAEVIALCSEHGWVPVLDDRQAVAEAKHRGLPVVRPESLILISFATNHCVERSAWSLQCLVSEKARARERPTFDPARQGDWQRALREVRELVEGASGELWEIVRDHAQSVEAVIDRHIRVLRQR